MSLTALIGCAPKIPELPKIPDIPDLPSIPEAPELPSIPEATELLKDMKVPELKTPELKKLIPIPVDPSVRAIDGINMELSNHPYQRIAGKVETSPQMAKFHIFSEGSGIREISNSHINAWQGLEIC